MAIYGGKGTYKGYDITFMFTPKRVWARIWKPNSLVLVKRFLRKDSVEAKKAAMNYLDNLENYRG